MKDLTEDEAKDCVNICQCGGKPKLRCEYLSKMYWYMCPICREVSEPAKSISYAVTKWNKENKEK